MNHASPAWIIVKRLATASFLFLAFLSSLWCSDVNAPSSCTSAVNQKLAELLAAGTQRPVDNVMVCGVTASASRTRRGGPHGDHQLLPLRVTFPDGSMRLIEVVTNDDLDGRVTAPANASVMAYGQAFFPTRGHFVAGIHEVHCATHRGADNGWVIVNGEKFPPSCNSR